FSHTVEPTPAAYPSWGEGCRAAQQGPRLTVVLGPRILRQLSHVVNPLISFPRGIFAGRLRGARFAGRSGPLRRRSGSAPGSKRSRVVPNPLSSKHAGR